MKENEENLYELMGPDFQDVIIFKKQQCKRVCYVFVRMPIICNNVQKYQKVCYILCKHVLEFC